MATYRETVECVKHRTGRTVNKARVGKQFSLRGLAKQVGIVPSYLADIEIDRRTPLESVLRRIPAVLDLDIDALMQQTRRLGEEAEPVPPPGKARRSAL